MVDKGGIKEKDKGVGEKEKAVPSEILNVTILGN